MRRPAARYFIACWFALTLLSGALAAQELPKVEKVELQPLAAQAKRLVEAMDYLGSPLRSADKQALQKALAESDSEKASSEIQSVLDKYCLFDVSINSESRVKVAQGAANAELLEQGWRSFLVKVRNEAGVTATLRAESPQAFPVFTTMGNGEPYHKQTITQNVVADRWLEVSMSNNQPLTPQLSGLELEYRIIHLYSRDRGKREATISFNIGQGTQDIGFRNDVAILFNCRPSANVTFRVLDEDGNPTTASFIIRDAQGHVYPSQAKRLAPDFAFQQQIYRADGEGVKLPAGEYTVEFTRGPEYLIKTHTIDVQGVEPQTFTFRCERWIDAAKLGWYSGDHHIHAAGCAHYADPIQGVLPRDVIRQIMGEALNVGSVLIWGAGYCFQRQFFEAKDNDLSSPDNLMHYDVEVSGFPSSFNGHIVLLNLKDQNYAGAKAIEDWPSWNLPILKWAKAQGAVVGYAHSGWGLGVQTDELPNYELPGFDGIGANEYVVDVTQDAVDFISAVNTPPTWELNIWYHTLNAGFRTRIGGETDFPCAYGERVGMGRSYVKVDGKLQFAAWVEGMRKGRSYVSDGKSHLVDFRVNDQFVGIGDGELKLMKSETVHVTAKAAARLDEQPNDPIRSRRYDKRSCWERVSEVAPWLREQSNDATRGWQGDKKPCWDIERGRIGRTREVPVELIVNGHAVARKAILADGMLREVGFDVAIERSSWVALRILPSSHTNPIFVIVGGERIRTSRRSAEWLLKAVDQCWRQKSPQIREKERPEAERAYAHARELYRQIIAESKVD
jgi:hypothetical protein